MELTEPGMLVMEELAAMALTRASFSSLLNVHFMTRPDLRFVEQVRSHGFRSALKHLTDPEVSNADVAAGASLMLEYVEATANTEATGVSDALGIERTRLYKGLGPSLGPPPPCESVWTTHTNDPALVLQELAKTYREAGMVLTAEAHQRPDYVGVELDYLGQLSLREARAWQAGNKKTAKECLEQQVRFLHEHLGCWVPGFIETALPMAETGFYRGHLLMLRGYLAEEAEGTKTLLNAL